MSDQDFEIYLSLLAKMLKLSDKQRTAIAAELRDHLEQRTAELQAEGVERQQAIQTAIEEFGDANVLASDFTQIRKHHSRRQIMRTGIGTIAVCAAITYGMVTLWPGNHAGSSLQPQVEAETSAQADLGGQAPASAPEEDDPARLMNQPMSLSGEPISLEAFVENIRTQTSQNIVVNWTGLENVEIGRDTLISLELRDVQASSVLQFALDEVSASQFGDDKAGYGYIDGVLVIDTIVSLEQRSMTQKLYDIQEIASIASANQAVSVQEAINQLKETIAETVGAPDEWLDEESTIQVFDSVLVINTHDENHRDIQSYLNALREIINENEQTRVQSLNEIIAEQQQALAQSRRIIASVPTAMATYLGHLEDARDAQIDAGKLPAHRDVQRIVQEIEAIRAELALIDAQSVATTTE